TACVAAPTANLLAGPAPYWHSYTYDKTGNRLTETRHEQSVERTYHYPEAGEPQSHAVTSVIQEAPGIRSLEEYAYDEAGNTISRQIGGDTQELTWSAEGGLEKVEEADGAVTEYLYDADGQRLIGRTPTETTLYLGHTEVTVAKGSATARGTRYVDAGGGHMVIFEDSGDISFSLADHHGTGQVSVDGYTMEVNHRRTLPFGGDRGPAPAYWPGTRGFVGGTKDTSTGLTHLGVREYGPILGRFISLDPVMDLTDPQQIHGYAYGNNNPLAFSDPTGLLSSSCPGGPASPCNQYNNYLQGLQSRGEIAKKKREQAIAQYVARSPVKSPVGGYCSCINAKRITERRSSASASPETRVVDASNISYYGAPLDERTYEWFQGMGYEGSREFTLNEAANFAAADEYGAIVQLIFLTGGGAPDVCQRRQLDFLAEESETLLSRGGEWIKDHANALGAGGILIAGSVAAGGCAAAGGPIGVAACVVGVGAVTGAASYTVGVYGTGAWDAGDMFIAAAVGGVTGRMAGPHIRYVVRDADAERVGRAVINLYRDAFKE
ncbi:RHS repeat domain-containing protein, partial [Streptomyces xiamenensis]|uniref:RHS repeat domain-containing protein n=1 Tax=Streptomyces xiamenensis TaxID=408015 RepID=UPI0035DFBDE8